MTTIKSNFDEVIAFDNGDILQIHAGEGDFLKLTLSSGVNSVTVDLDSIIAQRIVRMMQLLCYNQVEAKR